MSTNAIFNCKFIFYVVFPLEDLKVTDHSEHTGVNGKIIILKLILGKGDGKLWTGFMWLRVWTSGGLL
jgi:hypothetical protein